MKFIEDMDGRLLPVASIRAMAPKRVDGDHVFRVTLDHGETVTVYRESITGSVENTALPSTEKIEVMSCPTGNPNEFTAYGYATHITTNVLVPGAHQFYVTPTCWARKQADWCDFNPEWSEMDDNPVVVYFRHAGETHRSCYFSPMAHGLYDTWDEMLEEIARTHAHREQVLERHFAKKEKA